MNFLLDETLSPSIAEMFVSLGHDAVHVRDLEMAGASDREVLAAARSSKRIVISADTDFGELLARSNDDGPSVLLWRRQESRRAQELVNVIVANLNQIANDLETGAIVVIDETRIRIRSLPLFGDGHSNGE